MDKKTPLRKQLVLKVFCFGFMIDIMYVLWVLAVGTENLFLAGLASVGVAAPGLYGYLEVMKENRLIKFYLFGLFVGTICGILLKGYVT